jgi:hypothetical protein
LVKKRKLPDRPYRRSEWLSGSLEYGRKATKQAAWDVNNLAGLADGLVDAVRADTLERGDKIRPTDTVPVPRWVTQGLIQYIRATARQFKTGKGRHTRWVEKYHQDRIDFARYDLVHDLHLNHHLTLDDAFEKAAESLSGLAGGSE